MAISNGIAGGFDVWMRLLMCGLIATQSIAAMKGDRDHGKRDDTDT